MVGFAILREGRRILGLRYVDRCFLGWGDRVFAGMSDGLSMPKGKR